MEVPDVKVLIAMDFGKWLQQ